MTITQIWNLEISFVNDEFGHMMTLKNTLDMYQGVLKIIKEELHQIWNIYKKIY